jgi:hypothetical protein
LPGRHDAESRPRDLVVDEVVKRIYAKA